MEGYTRDKYAEALEDSDEEEDEDDILLPQKRTIKYSTILKEEEFIDEEE